MQVPSSTAMQFKYVNEKDIDSYHDELIANETNKKIERNKERMRNIEKSRYKRIYFIINY